MKKILRLHLGVGAISAALFVAIAVFVALTMRTMMVAEANKTVEGIVRASVANINGLVATVESAVDNTAWIVREHLDDPRAAVRITHELVQSNPVIVGSTVAFMPDYYPSKGRLYAPYACNDAKGGVVDSALRYDYTDDATHSEWFTVPIRTGGRYWCEPYFDEGGGEIMMSTYSVPILDAQSRPVAILTADVALDHLTRRLVRIRPYPNSYATLHTKSGKMLVPPPADRANGDDVDTVTVTGVADNGWTVSLVCPMENILDGARRVVGYIVVFSLLGLGLIVFVSWSFSNRLQRVTAARQRVDSELTIASAIQNSLVSVNLPDWAAARMRPAKEVGGDRYDFIERQGIAWFGIGDASGKGIPAALYTSLVGAGFRMGVGAGLSPVAIVRAVSNMIAEHNDTGMFVTAFIGCLDRKTGTFDFCNAGHNPPILVRPDGTVAPLEVRRNLAMGALGGYDYHPQSMQLAPGAKILLYTDGITEAMSAHGEQFGMERLLDFARRHAAESPHQIVDALVRAVDTFAHGAPQSDDITTLVVSA